MVATPRAADKTDSGSERVVFVDVLRLCAAVQMLQGHTLAALLSADHRSGAVHAAWTWLRGLTSVSFLFAAGMALFFATRPGFAEHRGARRRIVRALGLIALGYALHLPLAVVVSGGPLGSGIPELLAVDVLQCIGATLLILELARLASPTPRRWLLVVAALALLCFVATPFAQRVPPGALPAPLLAFLGPQLGSQFPLLPYAAHLFVGVLAGAWVAGDRGRAARRLAVLAVALLACATALRFHAGVGVVSDHLGRLGWVSAGTAALAAALRHVRRLPAWLAQLARESLFLYVFHVVLVYGRPWGLGAVLGARLDLPQALAAAAGVILLSGAAALARVHLTRLPARAGRVSRPSSPPPRENQA